MTCKELVELVTNYLEGALSPAERERFETHVAGCAGCAAYLDQIRQTVSLVGKLSEADVSPAASEALLAIFRNWQKG